MTTTVREAAQRQDEALARYFPGHDRAGHYGDDSSISSVRMVAEFLALVGAGVIFGIPGGASLPLSDALTWAHEQSLLRYVLTGHEQGAAFEAEGYAAASGRVGFCTATSGPGATNLITGLADAYRDSRPVLAITGNTATTAEPEAFQAIDIVGITHGKATKASFRPAHADDVQETLVRAYHCAVTGRPGSVLVDLPKDVQVQTATPRPWSEFIERFDWSSPCAEDAALAQAARLLALAERPVLYVGNGVTLADASDELRALSERHHIPVVTTVHALGTPPDDERLNLGMLGMHGSMAANLAPYLADLVVALGARFDDRVVGARPDRFAPDARVIHVDIDAGQLNRVRPVDLAIHGEVNDALRRLAMLMEPYARRDRTAWLDQLATLRRALPTQSYDDPADGALSHEFVYAAVGAALARAGADDVVASFDVGTHQMKGAQWFPVSRPRSFITSGGMGSMGCALPLAVGAHMARPGATVLAMVGDGGFVMSSHELDTIGAYGLPVKIMLFDDSALGMVHNWHHLFFQGRALTSDRRRGRATSAVDVEALKEGLRAGIECAASADDLATLVCAAASTLAQHEWPFFAATAASYGIPAERVQHKDQFVQACERALCTPGPYLVQVVLPRQAQVYPLMEPVTTPQEMVWRETAPGSGARVYAREHFDYEARCLRMAPQP